MSTHLELLTKINEKGLRQEFRKHIVYFAKLKRKGIISENEFLKSFDSILETLGH